jgi:hypothetical protein
MFARLSFLQHCHFSCGFVCLSFIPDVQYGIPSLPAFIDNKTMQIFENEALACCILKVSKK